MKYKVGDKLKNGLDKAEILSVENGYYHVLDKHGVFHWTQDELDRRDYTLHHDRPELKVDDKILVRDYANNNNYPWVRGHFAGWDGDKVKTFSDGKTLFTTNASYRTWSHYKLPESEG